MTGASLDLDIFREIPGYRGILKAVLKCQIQLLVEQLSEHTGEEAVLLSANVTEGTLSHLGSESGKGFLVENTDVKRQYLGYCLKRHQKRKSEFMSPTGTRHDVQPAKLVRTGPEPYVNFHVHKKPAFRMQRRNIRIRSGGKQFSSMFSKCSTMRSTNLKPTGNNVLTRNTPSLPSNQSSTHENSNQYEDQRSNESLNSEYDGQRSAESDEGQCSEIVNIKTEIMSDDDMDKVDEHVSNEAPKEVIVKVEQPDEIDEAVDERTKVTSEDMKTFGGGLGQQQYSPNDAMETEEGNQSFEYVLDTENSTDILTPWKPEDGDKNISQNSSKRKQSLPSRIAKSGEIRELRAGSQKFGTDNITYPRMQEDVLSHDHAQNWSADNMPKDGTSYGDIADDTGVSKGSDMIWTEETFQTNSPGGLKSYMKTPQIDGLFVSRGEGRFEKLIKCDDCGKVCRTSNMSRHRKRYCTALSKEMKSKSMENVGNNVYIDNPEKNLEKKQIRLDLTASDLIGHRQSNSATGTRTVDLPVGSGSSRGIVPIIKIEPSDGKNARDNNGDDGKFIHVVTKLGLRRTNAGLNKANDRSENSNAGLNKTNNGMDKFKSKFGNATGRQKIIYLGLNNTLSTDRVLENANTRLSNKNTLEERENKDDSVDVSAVHTTDNVDKDRNSTTAKTENDKNSPGFRKTMTDESSHSESNISHLQPLFPNRSETGLMDDVEQTPDFQPDLVIKLESPTSETETTDDSS